ncbi:aldose epimerase family protein [Actibacterium sp. 188UL27-1]|uniref:aldose epimerase family protein n=1 Tax=Actibacterium sp. 188UL27-1 TaxID=2786961 RepID=UPI00195A232F|nr:aldose epimerase family protein [Actibacterium sp. 188UL27-1]MBM7066282.1 galactose mutarotase [Actibacterium sp. 188UL27-1]
MTHFGTLNTGQRVEKLTIAAGDLTAAILTFGAILQDVRLAGIDHGLTLGSDQLAAYEGPYNSFGSVIGPVANRISNATATLGGATLHFEPNMDGKHTLHSGACGLRRKMWEVTDHQPDRITLTVTAAHGEGGFPGNRRWRVSYYIVPAGTLTMTLAATTDAPTLMNTVNHSYWNLDGTPTYAGHILRLAAEHYLPVDDSLLPTGEVAPVKDTAFDYRQGQTLGPDTAVDHNFCLSQTRAPLRPVAWLTGTSGLMMEMATTEPGLQVYDGGTIRSDDFPGHRGAPYDLQAGLALEAQFWPDAPKNPHFPSIRLDPSIPWEHVTSWTFSRPA